jgi:hypothetical protein
MFHLSTWAMNQILFLIINFICNQTIIKINIIRKLRDKYGFRYLVSKHEQLTRLYLIILFLGINFFI